MITFITGAPGSGKSAALVAMLQEVAKGRPIYVNGIPDLKIEHFELEDPTKWPETVPDGAVVVIDEVQRYWRPRGPGTKVPSDVAALETHRHRGLDFYIISQGPALLDKNVRALTGRHVHLRDIGFLGRWWYEWPECAENCATGWKQAPIKKRYRLPKHVFGKYRSASLHVKPVRSFPWMFVVMVAALAGTGYLTWSAYSTITARINPLDLDKKAAGQSGPVSAGGAPGAASGLSSLGPPAGSRPGVVAPIDEAVAFIPRIANRPETAPAFDHLRVVVNMPQVVGGVCTPRKCKCITDQGTDAGLSDADCRAWIDRPPFDPYRAREAAPAAQQVPSVAPSPSA